MPDSARLDSDEMDLKEMASEEEAQSESASETIAPQAASAGKLTGEAPPRSSHQPISESPGAPSSNESPDRESPDDESLEEEPSAGEEQLPPRLGGRDAWPPEPLVALGRFLRPHGVRGEVRLYPFARSAEHLAEQIPESATIWWPNGVARPCQIDSLFIHKGFLVLGLEGIEARAEAERLRGAFLCVRIEDRPPAPEGEFYFDELEGFDVVAANTGAPIGKVRRITEGAAHDYLEIQDASFPRTFLLPFIREFVLEIDTGRRILRARYPEGLADL